MIRSLVAVALLATLTVAQDAALEGHWLGALVRGRAALPVTVTFEARDDGWFATSRVPEWSTIFYDPTPVTADDDGTLRLRMPYGPAVLTLDVARRELSGEVTRQSGEVFAVHLKRVLRPPPPRHVSEDLTIDGPAGPIGATHVRPLGVDAAPTLVWVHGRGCWEGARRDFVDRATLLAEHGVASLVYDKRGTGETVGRCDLATLDDLAADLVAVVDHARTLPGVDAARVGTIGFSAGGWTSWRATELADAPADFVITVVGPTTSVEIQQRGNMRMICDELGVPDDVRAKSTRYLDLMFARGSDDVAVHAEMTALLEDARAEGWIDFHEDTDMVASVDDVPRLWVRRHGYDPAAAIAAWRRPALSILGGADTVVPIEENDALFERLARDNPHARLHVLPLAGHGLWIGEGTLPDGAPTFSRVAHGAYEEVLDFLDALAR